MCFEIPGAEQSQSASDSQTGIRCVATSQQPSPSIRRGHRPQCEQRSHGLGAQVHGGCCEGNDGDDGKSARDCRLVDAAHVFDAAFKAAQADADEDIECDLYAEEDGVPGGGDAQLEQKSAASLLCVEELLLGLARQRAQLLEGQQRTLGEEDAGREREKRHKKTLG